MPEQEISPGSQANHEANSTEPDTQNTRKSNLLNRANDRNQASATCPATYQSFGSIPACHEKNLLTDLNIAISIIFDGFPGIFKISFTVTKKHQPPETHKQVRWDAPVISPNKQTASRCLPRDAGVRAISGSTWLSHAFHRMTQILASESFNIDQECHSVFHQMLVVVPCWSVV